MRRYDQLKRRAVASFVLPDWLDDDSAFRQAARDASEENQAIVREAYIRATTQEQLPFDCIHIRQRSIESEQVWIQEVCIEARPTLQLAWKDTVRSRVLYGDDSARVFYMPEDERLQYGERDEGERRLIQTLLFPLLNLSDLLESRELRYGIVEQEPLTRQQRRAEGASWFYRSYIVVDHRRQHEGALTIGQFMRKHPMLHAVRGHLRHLSSGRTTWVRPHCRGDGELFQVKDYLIR